MNIENAFLTESVLPPEVLPGKKAKELQQLVGNDAKKKDAAKQFESVLLSKLMSTFESTTGLWDEQEDGAAKQIKSLFWSQLGTHVGENGGVGLWKQIYQTMQENGAKMHDNNNMDIEL